MKRYRAVVLAAAACFVLAVLISGVARAAGDRGPGGRGPEASPGRNAFPQDWFRWNQQQRRDWEQRMERQAPPGFFPRHWQSWNQDRRSRWWRNWETGNEEEGVFAVAFPRQWKGWSENRREKWWLDQVWNHRLTLLLDEERDGLLPWVFPSPLPGDWNRMNSAERDEWLRSDSPGHWREGVLVPKGWNDWSQSRKEDWWDDIADRAGFEVGDIFPPGWDSARKEQRAEWWDPMVRTGVGYLASALPDGWRRWRESERESWLRGVISAKESVARRSHARLRAALDSMENAARRGVPPSMIEEMGHQGLIHGLAPDRFRPFSGFIVGRALQGMHGDDLSREIRSEAEREGRGEMAPPERPGGRGTMGRGEGRGGSGRGNQEERGRSDRGGRDRGRNGGDRGRQ